jgi:hypothetical protein
MLITVHTTMFPEAAAAAGVLPCRWTLANGGVTGSTSALARRCAR